MNKTPLSPTIEELWISEREGYAMLFHFGARISSDEVVTAINDVHLKPSILPKMSALTNNHFEICKQSPIVPLGSWWRDEKGKIRVWVMAYALRNLRLFIGHWDWIWIPEVRFLANP